MEKDISTSSRTLHGRGTARLGAPRRPSTVFGRIRQHLLGVTLSCTFMLFSLMWSLRREPSRTFAPASRLVAESGYSSTLTTPPVSSEKWDGSHLSRRYGIAEPFAPEDKNLLTMVQQHQEGSYVLLYRDALARQAGKNLDGSPRRETITTDTGFDLPYEDDVRATTFGPL